MNTSQTTATDVPGPDALDFWIGEWTVSWPGGHGTNTVRRILDGRVVEEVFESHDDDGEFLHGRSLSVRDSADGRWRQTWVDSTGSYLDFEAVEVDGRICFRRETEIGGLPVAQRMVWLDVTTDGFRWEWQHSRDGGATWQVTWPLDYRRVT
ncbi:MAG TPA: hypothetical protein VKB69_13425 [Micromonosporaceae bacterium]|nr:hypothetical protein [Micromonosporaceae bacterium]